MYAPNGNNEELPVQRRTSLQDCTYKQALLNEEKHSESCRFRMQPSKKLFWR